MVDVVLHARTAAAVAEYFERPTQPLLVTGPTGCGKSTVASMIARQLLRDTTTYLYKISPEDGRAIPIEAVRKMLQALTLSVPGQADGDVTRVVLIEDVHRMTAEAQNALLKTLEEPPDGTILILTASSPDAVLSTIRSRVRQMAVLPPAADAMEEYFLAQGYPSAQVKKALMLSGELPGLAAALLAEDDSHPMMAATAHARGILQSTAYERLLLVDGLSKQKDLCLDVLFVLMQMARMALLRPASVHAAVRWRKILQASYEAQAALRHNTQTKLVLINLMLAF